MVPVGTFTIPPDHACLPGHFPGRPVVPGVLLLEETLTLALAAQAPGQTLAGLASVKFTGPVLPGETVDVAATRSAPAQLDFACTVAGRPVAHGRARLAPRSAP